MNPKTLPRLLRTVRHLRLSQLGWRCRAVAERRRRAPHSADVPSEAVDPAAVGLDLPEVPWFHRAGPEGGDLVGELARGRFSHLARGRDLGRERPAWRLGEVGEGRLWTITLHYHEWAYGLAEVAAGEGAAGDEAAALLSHYLSDWMARCDLGAPGARALAWNSFSLATRLAWWIRAWRLLRERRPEPWAALEPRLLSSAWKQADYLHRHLEWDLRGNHLIRDLVGLAWAGRFFAGEEARRWTATAGSLVLDQVAEQVLRDGAHFERSPTYHLHVMEDLLSLALLLPDPAVVEELKSAWLRMADYLAWVRHPDGYVPLLNDGGMHALCAPGRMLALGKHIGVARDAGLPRGGRHFPDAGLVVWHGEPWSLFFDVGEIGADHVPGHGHADTLTLEASYRGRRLFVDPGTFGYDRDERRRRDRATASHNTVAIDREDSSEVWDIFRVGRRARPIDVREGFDADGFEASAGHTGYAHRAGRPVHRRRLSARPDGAIVVADALEGRGSHHVRGGWLLDPAWRAEPAASGWLLSRGDLRLRVEVRGGGAEPVLGLVEAPYHPDYGVEVATRRLEWECEQPFPFEVRTEVVPA